MTVNPLVPELSSPVSPNPVPPNPVPPNPGSLPDGGISPAELNFPSVMDDLNRLLAVLPPKLQEALYRHPQLDHLIEVVLDLGRQPEVRFPERVDYILPDPVTRMDLDYVTSLVGEFSGDNRAGIESTLHRISAIRNRKGAVVGLTCRVGRCVLGSISMIQDLVEQGKSLLLLGRPGVGKTTALREIARVLADSFQKRVVIIDTSNEIAGDGDIPHPGIGRARRMQVATPEQQHKIMIEAVENHMPQVVVIDEIGTELEALAARTIAERGVQLVATAHGNQMENLIKNPTLCDLVGGIQSVTLGDDEARRRGSQKTVLERKAPPTFDIAVEMTERTRWVVYDDVSATVDLLLRGREPRIQIRSLQADGKISVEHPLPTGPQWSGAASGLMPPPSRSRSGSGWRRSGRLEPIPLDRPPLDSSPTALPAQASPPLPGSVGNLYSFAREDGFPQDDEEGLSERDLRFAPTAEPLEEEDLDGMGKRRPLTVYPYGISTFYLDQVIATLHLQADVTKDLDQADVILALRSQVRNRSKIHHLAQIRQIPIHTVKVNTLESVARSLRRLLNIEEPEESEVSELEALIRSDSSDELEALEEARLAVEQIVIPKAQPVELLPRSGAIRKLQHQLVEHYHLKARSFGEEPNRRLRIFPN